MTARIFFAAACAVALLLGRNLTAAEPVEVPPGAAAIEEKHGVYPIAYQEIITRWMKGRLIDPESAQFEWLHKPKAISMKTGDGSTFYGYMVDFKVNSRNKFGMYTGKQAYRVYLKNGEVVGSGRVRP